VLSKKPASSTKRTLTDVAKAIEEASSIEHAGGSKSMPGFPTFVPDIHANDSLIADAIRQDPDFLPKCKKKWFQTERRILEMFPENRSAEKVCGTVPRALDEYVLHMASMMADLGRAVDKYCEVQETYDKYGRAPSRAFGGYKFGELGIPIHDLYAKYSGKDRTVHPFVMDDHPGHPMRSPVLFELSIWTRGGPFRCVPWRPVVDWPGSMEMAWEGDQRVASENGRYGRFPGLPRIYSDNEGVVFHNRPYVRPWDFDQVWHVPQMDDIIAPIDEIEEEVIPALLNQELLDAIDDDVVPFGFNTIRDKLGLPLASMSDIGDLQL
jgi:hypothetical protein